MSEIDDIEWLEMKLDSSSEEKKSAIKDILDEDLVEMLPKLIEILSSDEDPTVRVEAACASGAVAMRMGYFAVASGMYDLVAVGGVEKIIWKHH